MVRLLFRFFKTPSLEKRNLRKRQPLQVRVQFNRCCGLLFKVPYGLGLRGIHVRGFILLGFVPYVLGCFQARQVLGRGSTGFRHGEAQWYVHNYLGHQYSRTFTDT